MSDRRLVVALPVRDEAAHLPACLHALTSQTVQATIVVLVNNSSDGSAAIARRCAKTSACEIIVDDVMLAEPDANAGGARRLAMHKAAALAGADGIVLTTDADGSVAPNWLRANLAAIRGGADAVAGRAVIDPVDEALIPQALIDADARECRYAALLDEIAAALDPDPADPWPRHDEHSGASIAVTVAALRRAGGIPVMAMGEDRAFFRNLRRIDARIRHAPDATVIVSGRTEGRATGGMADTIRRRLSCPDMFLDDRLEPARDAMLRARLRHRARLVWTGGAADLRETGALARALQLPTATVRNRLASPLFGTAWEKLESASPALRRRPVPAASVMHEIAAASLLLAACRGPDLPDCQAVGVSA